LCSDCGKHPLPFAFSGFLFSFPVKALPAATFSAFRETLYPHGFHAFLQFSASAAGFIGSDTTLTPCGF